MNTIQNTEHIIATVIVAVTARLALAVCAQQSGPDEPAQRLMSAQLAELRSGPRRTR